MTLIVLLLLAGVGAYVMKPDERLRYAGIVLRPIEGFWFSYKEGRGRPDEFRDALRARTGRPLATWAILTVYVLGFVVIGTGPDALAHWGATLGPLATGGEWWRLLTASFIHAGFFALLIDAAGLAQPATLVEQMLGHTAFAVIYLSGAVLGTVIELSQHPLAVTVGPLGGILAVYGLFAAVLVRGVLRPSPMTIPAHVLRFLAPAAGLFLLRALFAGALFQPAGLVPLALGFVFGIVLARHAAEGPARVNRSVAIAAASLIAAVGIAIPLRGVVDARPEVARVLAVEDRTASEYAAAVKQFKLGALKGDAVAQMIERRIKPEVDQEQTRLAALGRVPAEQQPLVKAAVEYAALRNESWQLRVTGFHKANMRLLRDAEEKERAALAALDRLRPPA
jgi:rhomboid protease GluP